MKSLFLFIFILHAALLPAQDITSRVSQQVAAIRSGNTAIGKEPEAVFQALQTYRKDTLATVRSWVYDGYRDILAEHTKPQSMRQEIAAQLIKGIADAETRNRNDCVEYLTGCRKDDFTEQAQARFCDIFNSKAWFSRDLVLLAGFIDNPACKTTLESLAFSPEKNQRKLQWHANLALARMGDNNAMSWCLSQVSRIGINDDVTYELLPGLVYTRQQRAIEYLVTVINSDENLCSSANPDSEQKILCGYRVMEYLAPVVKKYPLKQLPSGDIDTKDYHKALLSVREWFAKQKGEYEMVRDTF